MPCLDGGPNCSETDAAKIKELQSRLDLTTHLLCEILTQVEEGGFADDCYQAELSDLSLEVQSWWAEHKKQDEARQAKERARQMADRVRQRAIWIRRREELETELASLDHNLEATKLP